MTLGIGPHSSLLIKSYTIRLFLEYFSNTALKTVFLSNIGKLSIDVSYKEGASLGGRDPQGTTPPQSLVARSSSLYGLA